MRICVTEVFSSVPDGFEKDHITFASGYRK